MLIGNAFLLLKLLRIDDKLRILEIILITASSQTHPNL